MLIKALNDYYDILSAAGKVCPEGLSMQKVSHKIMLRPDGTVSDIVDIRQPTPPDSKGKVKYEPVEITLPARTQKPGIDFNIIEHRPLYIFGLNYNKGEFSAVDATNKAKKSHDCFVNGNLEFTEGMTSEIVTAYRNFIKNWNPEAETENGQLKALGKDYSGGYFCFALDGHPDITSHDMDGEIMRKYMSTAKKEETADGICSISGEAGNVARIHDKIKGVRGGQAAGGLLVCFNSSAEESYGKEQSYNSGISQKVMKHYTEALNTLISDR
ncbi:MAG: type I-C CRISPR-associated protein Cas8c/Csd1, partial [Clostridia bacterium]